ncbi:hypothetical protein [Limnoglobus roseus]|uniref:Uncharacterized protein n=1 Tax=Limnoglobus roseus TaxID=2598579 RepID=A0A5C1AR71_9BACT|nr:hypothetical protein [Limnoglobus roseus]QEL21115.1 hypothetical protein PX52LOC_08245 [Limnoglobus roseus]
MLPLLLSAFVAVPNPPQVIFVDDMTGVHQPMGPRVDIVDTAALKSRMGGSDTPKNGTDPMDAAAIEAFDKLMAKKKLNPK